MREATARYEPDYTLSEESVETKPRRRRKTVSPAAARAAENRARLMAALRYTADNPVKVLGTACLAVAAISFTINALFFQQGRHPAPLGLKSLKPLYVGPPFGAALLLTQV